MRRYLPAIASFHRFESGLHPHYLEVRMQVLWLVWLKNVSIGVLVTFSPLIYFLGQELDLSDQGSAPSLFAAREIISTWLLNLLPLIILCLILLSVWRSNPIFDERHRRGLEWFHKAALTTILLLVAMTGTVRKLNEPKFLPYIHCTFALSEEQNYKFCSTAHLFIIIIIALAILFVIIIIWRLYDSDILKPISITNDLYILLTKGISKNLAKEIQYVLGSRKKGNLRREFFNDSASANKFEDYLIAFKLLGMANDGRYSCYNLHYLFYLFICAPVTIPVAIMFAVPMLLMLVEMGNLSAYKLPLGLCAFSWGGWAGYFLAGLREELRTMAIRSPDVRLRNTAAFDDSLRKLANHYTGSTNAIASVVISLTAAPIYLSYLGMFT